MFVFFFVLFFTVLWQEELAWLIHCKRILGYFCILRPETEDNSYFFSTLFQVKKKEFVIFPKSSQNNSDNIIMRVRLVCCYILSFVQWLRIFLLTIFFFPISNTQYFAFRLSHTIRNLTHPLQYFFLNQKCCVRCGFTTTAASYPLEKHKKNRKATA